MKMFSFIISLLTFLVSLFYLIFDFPDLDNTNGIIYFSMLSILILICIIGVIVNMPIHFKNHRRLKDHHDKYNMHI